MIPKEIEELERILDAIDEIDRPVCIVYTSSDSTDIRVL